MKSSESQPKFFTISGRRALMSLALASLLGCVSISPALADRNYGHDRDRHGDYGQRGWHNTHHRAWRAPQQGHWSRPEYRQPYIYAQPIYVVPPAYYEPRRPSGISLYFPLDFRR